MIKVKDIFTLMEQVLNLTITIIKILYQFKKWRTVFCRSQIIHITMKKSEISRKIKEKNNFSQKKLLIREIQRLRCIYIHFFWCFILKNGKNYGQLIWYEENEESILKTFQLLHCKKCGIKNYIKKSENVPFPTISPHIIPMP